MDEPDYSSVDAKLGRAVTHYQIIYNEIEKWTNSCKMRASLHDNADHTHHEIRWHHDGPTPNFLDWTLILADCINNLRSSLDHLIYAVAKFKTLKGPPADIERLAFIITDTLEEWRENQSRIGVNVKRGTSILGPRVVDAIHGLQPSIRKHPTLPPLLGILRKFSNADKHRLLQVANSAVIEWDLSFWGQEGGTKLLVNPQPIKNGDVVCVIETFEPDPDFAIQRGKIVTMVALWHGLRDGDTDPLNDRMGVTILIPFLINEVKYAIDVVKHAAI
jgi:hypothetical protein